MTEGPPPDVPAGSTAPEAGASEPNASTLRPYELPTARRVVTFGLSLAYQASGELRRASIYIGLLTLALLGPPMVLLVEFIVHFQIFDLDTLNQYAAGGVPDPSFVGPLVLLYVVGLLGFVGWFAVTIDAELIAVALLAARAGDRPFTLRDATIRSRQVFWRMIRGRIIVGLAGVLLSYVLAAILGAIFVAAGTASSFMVSVIQVLLLAPFGYLATAVVLGDVGAMEALRRSVALFRARKRIAFVVALFTLVTAAIELFGLGAGVDLFSRAAAFVHLGIAEGGAPLVLALLGVLALVMAFGSLTFTIGALVLAPQVAAFLGLTYYTGGLDRAREAPAAGARTFRWVTRPMIACIALCLVGSGLGVLTLGSAPAVAGANDPILQDLRVAGHAVRQIGLAAVGTDPAGDEAGGTEPAADILSAEYAELTEVPAWLLRDVFDCFKPLVTCGYAGSVPAAFKYGAVLVLIRLAGPPATDAGAHGAWGPALQLVGFSPAPATDQRFPFATHAVMTQLADGVLSLHYEELESGSWNQYGTFARSAFIGNDLLTLMPINDELVSATLGWNAYASFASSPSSPVTDRLIDAAGGSLLGVPADPPLVLFPDEGSPTP